MKKLTTVVLMIILVLSLVGCNKESEDSVVEAAADVVNSSVVEIVEDIIVEPEVVEAKDIAVNKEQIDKNDALFQTYATEEIEPIWQFVDVDAIGNWDNPIITSPFGDQSNYKSTKYLESKSFEFEYVDENQMYNKVKLYGDYWDLRFNSNNDLSKDENKQMPYDYKQFITKNDFKYMGQYRESWVFYSESLDHCWVEATENRFVVFHENRANLNEEIVINPADYERNEVYMSFNMPDDKFVSLISSIDHGNAFIDTELRTQYRDYSRRTLVRTEMREKEGLIFVDDDFIYEPGLAVMHVTWNDSTPPDEIKIKLEAKYDVEPINYGEELGGIILDSNLVSSISILPTLDDSLVIKHPEYDDDSLYFDKTQDNSYIVFVPAGYYELNIKTKDGIVTDFRTLKVPVHSGKVTTVDVPQSITDSFKAVAASRERGLFISDVVENSDTVSFVFSMIDETTKSVKPDLENSTIYEGGKLVDIVSIEPIPTPPSIVLLLDSSGSMKGQMDQTVVAAKNFLDGLPSDTIIKVIDFDSEPKLLQGATVDSLKTELDIVKAKGATALYDSVLMGLELLEGADRATLVVFTDGEDANLNDTARGSVATQEEALSKIVSSNIPLYTIGFGEGHDSSTLELFSDASLGKYYSAENQEALNEVFKSINDKLGNTYIAKYKRPTESSVSDIPVVSFVIDVSGSMYSNFRFPSDFRLDDVKNIYHDFVEALPNEAQVMVTSFNDEIHMQQGVTTDKILALNAVGNLEAGGGTDIYGSVKYGTESLSRVASSKKVMIYITDAAFEVDEEFKELSNKQLAKLDEENIHVLWVGMGIQDETPFKEAAALSNGHYIVTENTEEIKEKFEVMLNEVKNAQPSGDTAITLHVRKKTEEGAFEAFSQSVLFPLSPVKKSDEVIIQDTIKYSTTDMVKQYDAVSSQYMSGETVQADETIITKRISVDSTGSNEAMTLDIKEIIFSSRLAGVNAPKGQRFMGVIMDMTHILPEQEVVVYPDGSGHPSSWIGSSDKGKIEMTKIPYSVPNFTSHFGMSFNKEGPYPAATATWLAYEPIVVPGQYDVTLMPDEVKTGMMVYIVPDEAMGQVGIHYYDDNYGYIDVALVDVVPEFRATYHPGTKAAQKLLDNFTLEVTGVEDWPIDETIVNSQHRLIEGNFISDVKANINVSPDESMYLKFPTQNGEFYTKLSARSSGIPMGFYMPRALTPGSRNPIRMLFQMPLSLDKFASTLFLDLKDEDVNIEVTKGNMLDAMVMDSFETEYFKTDINDLYKYDGKILDTNRNWVVADITIHDIKDGYASRGIPKNFYIDFTRDENTVIPEDTSTSPGLGGFAASDTAGYASSSRFLYRSDQSLKISEKTSELLFGLDEDAIIYDGTSRRGFIIFEVRNFFEEEWRLEFDQSDFALDVQIEPKSDQMSLLIEKEEADVDNKYEQELSVALVKAIADYKLRFPLAKRTKTANESLYDDVVMPSINAYGYQLVNQIKDVETLEQTIKSLRFVSGGSAKGHKHIFSKEAVLTQGFGTEADMANLANDILSRLGYKTKRRVVTLTDRGNEILSELSGQEGLNLTQLPAISYENELGESKLLVLPFGRDAKTLEGIVVYEPSEVSKFESPTTKLSIYYDVLPTEEGHVAQMNKMSGALSGGSNTVEVTRKTLDSFFIGLDTYSLDAIDIGTAVVDNKAYPVLYTANGMIMSEEYVDLAYYGIKGMGITISNITHHVNITDDMDVNQVFMTVGFNLPELPSDAAELISEYMNGSSALKADTLASLKWLHRKALYKFIADQTSFERDLDKAYDLVTGRIDNPRFIIVQSVMDGELVMSMDLLRIQNDLHTGDKDAHNSYRLISGLTASQLEAEALTNGVGLESIWESMPESAHLVLFDTYDLDIYEEDMFANGMREDMIEYFNSTNKMVIIQSEPSEVDGKKRWAWLEIDKHDYETISVIDTFEHGSLASNATLNSALEKAQYVIGAFKGVESSVWSVSAFSLELSNYEDILKSAKAFALGIGKNFEAEIGPIKLSGGQPPALNDNLKKILGHFKKGKEEEDSKGFKEGYKDGVEFYFKVAN